MTKKVGYWKLKVEALDCSLWTTCFGREYGPVVRLTREWIKYFLQLYFNNSKLIYFYNFKISIILEWII